jgi:hypothetical protein
MHLQWSLIKNLLPSCCSSQIIKQDFDFFAESNFCHLCAFSLHLISERWLRGSNNNDNCGLQRGPSISRMLYAGKLNARETSKQRVAGDYFFSVLCLFLCLPVCPLQIPRFCLSFCYRIINERPSVLPCLVAQLMMQFYWKNPTTESSTMLVNALWC